MLQKIFVGLIALFLLGGLVGLWFINTPEFGRSPQGARLTRILNSPQFTAGCFTPPEPIVNHFEGNILSLWYQFLFGRHDNLRPQTEIPHFKPDFTQLEPHEDLVIWLGHSSFFLQLSGLKILVDPVFEGHASPLPFMLRAFPGSDVCTVQDLPPIDLLLISHDHWDHLEYDTIRALEGKTTLVVCGLGVGEYFDMWGYPPEKICELDWGEAVRVEDLTVHVTPARHFTGRLFRKNPTEPVSFVLESPSRKVFYSGDSGYGQHFNAIAHRFAPVDLAIIEAGQYDRQWPNVHLHPQEIKQVTEQLKASYLMPVHNSKFVLANHSWQEPLAILKQLYTNSSTTLLTPQIGQKLKLDTPDQTNAWWED